MPPTQVQLRERIIDRAKEFFAAIQTFINNPMNGSFITLRGNSEKNPKFYDITLEVNGTNKQNVCRVIVSEKVSEVYSAGDVIMSSTIIQATQQHEKYISFNLNREQVSEIDNLRNLFTEGLLVDRTRFQQGWFEKGMVLAVPSQGGTDVSRMDVRQLKDKIASLEATIAFQERTAQFQQRYVDYVLEIRAIPAPASEA
mmetsp:Transcript_4561/g.8575  ORF Transcript_4561/g.8575 Transcript_4561/m.8575 type:complete len:199 (-) Transcript_4561:302-898(-)